MVTILNKQTSKDKHIMAVVRAIVLMQLKYNDVLSAQHIPGVQNVLSDAISRQQETVDLLERYGMKPRPMEIPAHLQRQNFDMG